MNSKFCFAIDRGGTFTDIFALCPNKKIRLLKLLSDDPANYSDAPREGIRRIIIQETSCEILPDAAIPTEDLDWIRMGTTVATNALLERKGERIALLITQGFRDLLHIGNQARPSIFSLEIVCPEHLYEEVVEIEERLVLQQESCELKRNCTRLSATTGEIVEIWKSLNEKQVKNELLKLQKKGIQSLAVVLMHSYLFPAHENKIKDIAVGMGFKHVSLSSEVMPMLRIVPRGHTACVDAYLTPCIKKYVENFSSGFQNKLMDVNVLFMQSDGGLTPMDLFCGSRAVLSGPAGGVIGYSKTAFENFSEHPVIGFDMGGTSTDVSRFDGHFEHVYDTAIAGVNIQSPQLDIQTVAAGGGSMLFFRSGLLAVGPESAGAHPGPVCYRKGGPLTVTDANLVLGRLQPEFFPKIFGISKDLPLDKEAALKAFEKLKNEINDFIMSHNSDGGKHLYSLHELALGFVTVANEAMSRPIRALTQGKGFDTSQHILAVFGGAGSQHACSIAKNLGISTIFIHKYAGILSAFGMALANVVSEAQESSSVIFASENFSYINSRLGALSKASIHKLKMQGFKEDQISVELFLNMRYDKTDCALMCTSSSDQITGFLDSFLGRYKREFGFSIPDRPVRVDDIRVRGLAKHCFDLPSNKRTSDMPPKHKTVEECYFHGTLLDTKIFLIEDLCHGHKIPGPAIIIDSNCTILVEPDCLASMTEDGSIIIKVSKSGNVKIGTELDMIQLSIFSHRFMSIAEQMGKVLQRTAISTNMKERLDFSCALFGPDGGLVSNAPHIPVHLGSMQEAVKFQIRHLGESIRDGDVVLSNHPLAGGTHLPDLTVITPVFYQMSLKPIFFVASRGHHADIGGLTPGSMPAHSTCLAHEGAAFLSFKLVENGIFLEEAVSELLQDSSKAPGCTGTRNLQDNLSDLKAQVSANKKGITLVLELIEEYSLEVVQCYMAYIQKNADIAVRHMLMKVGRAAMEKTASSTLTSSDYMDDGTPIQLKVDIDTETGSATFDFEGTGYEVYGNCNAPKAVCFSAIIYCLRCMIEHDIPLNQGCLSPIQVIIPEGSILSPSEEAAVVGGNVLTSQRIVDVIFKAFKTCAASQGCMNNITFGDEKMGYYETVAGGSGAGSHFDGRSGVHTHMTNTRITDPEVLEKRYPVVLERFHLQEGTGGCGRYKGGDGVLRKFLFRKNVTLSVLTERRVFAPYGLEGGEDGEKGLNLLIRKNGRTINLGPKNSVQVSPGDSFLLQTPGGGGYGVALENH